MRLTFLGTGTSFGVPVVGCTCATCTSPDPRDRRGRHAALLRWEDGRAVLVDTPPELRLQLVRAGADRVDAVWFTHAHADHVHGIDDLRIFSLRRRRNLPAFASAATREAIVGRFEYIFDDRIRPDRGSSKPEIELHAVDPDEEVVIAGEPFLPLPVPHGSVTSFGFRVGDLGYVTDAKRLTRTVAERLRGVRVLVLNALWFGSPHPTHFNVEEAVDAAAAIGAERTYLTHLTHRTRHAELEARLPDTVRPAWDGLSVEVGSTIREESR